MADHRATWVRLYPDDDMAAEAAARALFDKEEAASYAADLDARAEEQDVLDTARAATRLRGELQEELRAESSGASGTEEEYVQLDAVDLDCRRLRRSVGVASIKLVAVYTPLVYHFCLFLLRTQICKIYLILMTSSKFNENFAIIKFQFF
jgi:hypothetical protein